jgi:hypothetical protein
MLKPTDTKHQKSKDLLLKQDSEERESLKNKKSPDQRKTLYLLKNTRRFMMFGPAREELISKSEKLQRLQSKNLKRLNPRRKSPRR